MTREFYREQLMNHNENINIHYMNRYLNYLEKIQNSGRIFPKGYKKEKHHILPKSLFPEFSSLKENKWNSVQLTYREHFIAHWLLYSMRVSDKMALASKWMINGRKDQNIRISNFLKSSKMYEKIRSEASAARSKSLKEFYSGMTDEESKKFFDDINSRKTPERLEETSKDVSNSKLGEKNPMFGKDITNSLSPEVNKRREENAKKGVRDFHKNNPAWIRSMEEAWVFWLFIKEIEYFHSKGCSTGEIQKMIIGKRKIKSCHNTIIRIISRKHNGTLPLEELRGKLLAEDEKFLLKCEKRVNRYINSKKVFRYIGRKRKIIKI